MMKARGLAATKTLGAVLAATAVSLVVTAGPAYAATGFSPVPMKKHHHSGNSIQAPVQACGNNVGSNIIFGAGSKNQSVKSKNSGDCKQKTSSH